MTEVQEIPVLLMTVNCDAVKRAECFLNRLDWNTVLKLSFFRKRKGYTLQYPKRKMFTKTPRGYYNYEPLFTHLECAHALLIKSLSFQMCKSLFFGQTFINTTMSMDFL